MRYPLTVLLILLSGMYVFGQRVQLHDLKFSSQIEKENNAGTLSGSAAAYYLTYIGKYREALNLYEVPLEWGLTHFSAKEKADFQTYRPVSAYQYLEERTKDEQLVIISEAHHKPQHRVFTRNMLSALYANGFRYLGVEALSPNYDDPSVYLMDDDLQERGYPLYGPVSGSYTREPQMSNMIREAIALGFEVFGYEGGNEEVERDLWQAQRIKKFMDEHPDGKVVIHCGWYHAIESNFPKRNNDNYMAYHLKQITGIDPLTIYQDALTERFIDEESPYYKAVKANEVSVLVNGAGEVFNGKPGQQHFDILVYHPHTKYRKNRPNWLYHLPNHTFVKVKSGLVPKENYPVLVKAYPIGEVQEATPVDVIELSSPHDNTYLVLKKGKYRIEMIDGRGEELEYDLEFN